MPPTLTDLQDALKFGYHAQSCANCRYFRILSPRDDNGQACTSECLLLGRTLGIVSSGSHQLISWGMSRICDGWRKCPRARNVYVSDNPYWHDPYLKRKSQKRLRYKAMHGHITSQSTPTAKTQRLNSIVMANNTKTTRFQGNQWYET